MWSALCLNNLLKRVEPRKSIVKLAAFLKKSILGGGAKEVEQVGEVSLRRLEPDYAC